MQERAFVKTAAEATEEIDRRLRDYRLQAKGSWTLDEQANDESKLEAEACKTELLSLRRFLLGY